MSEEEWKRSMDLRMRAVEVTLATSTVMDANIDRRLGEIEGTLRWLVRLVIGTLILGILGVYVQNGVLLQ